MFLDEVDDVKDAMEGVGVDGEDLFSDIFLMYYYYNVIQCQGI